MDRRAKPKVAKQGVILDDRSAEYWRPDMHSEDYKQQLQEVHAGRPARKKWGTTGARNFGAWVGDYVRDHNGWIKSVLDFGAGQRTLGQRVTRDVTTCAFTWTDYDPGIPEIAVRERLAESYDLVVSSDVLEHVEPEYLDATLAEIRSLAKKAQYHHIACDPCGLILPDGRNAHLSIHSPEEWREMLEVDGWKVQYWNNELERKRSGLRRACRILLEKT